MLVCDFFTFQMKDKFCVLSQMFCLRVSHVNLRVSIFYWHEMVGHFSLAVNFGSIWHRSQFNKVCCIVFCVCNCIHVFAHVCFSVCVVPIMCVLACNIVPYGVARSKITDMVYISLAFTINKSPSFFIYVHDSPMAAVHTVLVEVLYLSKHSFHGTNQVFWFYLQVLN